MPTTSPARAATRRPSRRTALIVSLVAVPVAVAVSGVVVAQSSYSAYSSSTANPTSNWATGTVALTNDQPNTAAFSVTNGKPGQTASKCIVVSSSGSLPSSVKLYGTTPATTRALASNINLVVTQGSGGSANGSCTGFTALTSGSAVYSGTLADFSSSATGYATGVGSWATAGVASGASPETRTYQIVYTIRADAPNDTQNGSAAVGFTWEAQNT